MAKEFAKEITFTLFFHTIGVLQEIALRSLDEKT